MAAVQAAVATSAFTFIMNLSRSQSFARITHFSLRRVITSSISTSSSDITFAPSKPKPSSSTVTLTSNSGKQHLDIHRIVRKWKGSHALQSTRPSRPLHAGANAKTSKTIKKSESAPKTKPVKPSTEPKYSKAARRFYNENFRDPPQRLSKILAAAGVASRRSCEELIFQGRVTVNGTACNTPQTRVDPAKDIIYVNGRRISKKLPPKVYFALNKPKGYICSCGEKETRSVMSLFDDFMKSWNRKHPGEPKPRLFTVGRLDVATSGLIIVTNDGEFAQKVSHPSSNMSKEYIATVDGDVNKRHLNAICEGTVIEGVQCTPDFVELLPKQPDISRHRIRIVVHEGRNHEVREIVKNAGLQIHALKRVRIGSFRLPTDLALGKHVELKAATLMTLGWKK
ncbi:unnamed protein product [Cuscuta epithymum]|uniref:RNA-binding S4 domain-containing protein n=1 Tax=Cuscuta epithymum TaxID=186058 RepID=A0AAV0FQI8_9ASTE|nr:unnamed protein product [Cuscuta epithymum]CAH9137579.1 unnamed protein product [Cuscuta epithymum]